MNIYGRANKLFGKIVKNNKKYFKLIEPKLKIARIKVPIEAYGSLILFLTLSSFAVSFLFLTLIGLLTVGFSLIGILMNLFVAIFIGILVGGFIYLYPSFVISEKKEKIENSLAFVSIYMSTLSKSGFEPQKIFGLLGNFKDYPTAADEARKIDHEVNKLGMDLKTSLDRAIKRSPSPEWTEFLAGIKNSIEVGGDLDKYLNEKSIGFVHEYKRKLEAFGKTLTLLMNLYITIIIVGTIFFIVVSSLMGAVGGVSVSTIKLLHYLTIFAGLPLITTGVILLIKSSSQWAE